MLIGMADGDGRAALTLAEEVWRAARPGEVFDPAGLLDGRPAPGADLRQGAGRPLQPDLGAAQVGARLRPRRGALLPRPHARCRRAAALHRPPAGAHGDARTSAWPTRRRWWSRSPPRMPTTISARRRANWRWREATVYLATAPKSNAIYTAFGAAMRTRQGERARSAAEAHPQRADAADEAGGLRRRLPLRPDEPEAFSGQDYFPEALGRQTFYDPPDRGFEREIRKRLDALGKAEARAGRRVSMVVTDGPPTLAARASRVWSRFVASVMAARAARRQEEAVGAPDGR